MRCSRAAPVRSADLEFLDAAAEGRVDELVAFWRPKTCAGWCKWSDDNCVLPAKKDACADCESAAAAPPPPGWAPPARTAQMPLAHRVLAAPPLIRTHLACMHAPPPSVRRGSASSGERRG